MLHGWMHVRTQLKTFQQGTLRRDLFRLQRQMKYIFREVKLLKKYNLWQVNTSCTTGTQNFKETIKT